MFSKLDTQDGYYWILVKKGRHLTLAFMFPDKDGKGLCWWYIWHNKQNSHISPHSLAHAPSWPNILPRNLYKSPLVPYTRTLFSIQDLPLLNSQRIGYPLRAQHIYKELLLDPRMIPWRIARYLILTPGISRIRGPDFGLTLQPTVSLFAWHLFYIGSITSNTESRL